MTLAQAPAGYLTDRIGPRWLMWGTWLLGTLAAWMMALAGSLEFFIVGLLAYGLTSTALAPMNSYITAVRGSWRAERALTTATASFTLGMVIGPAIGGALANHYELRSVYILAGCLFMVSTLLVLFTRQPPGHGSREPTRARRLLSNRSFIGLFVLVFIAMFALYLPQPLTPNYLSDVHNLTLQQIGWLGTFGSLGTTLLALGLGGLHGSAGFLIGQPLVGLFALLIWRGNSFGWFAAAYFLSGGYRLVRVMALGLARRLIHPGETGLAYGLMETANGAAVILAPALAGVLYSQATDNLYTVSILLIFISFALSLFGLPLILKKHSHLDSVAAETTE